MYTHICVYMYMCMYMYIHIYIYIYMYTYYIIMILIIMIIIIIIISAPPWSLGVSCGAHGAESPVSAPRRHERARRFSAACYTRT